LTQCTPSSNETNSWKKRLIALEGMMAQTVATMQKNLGAQVTTKEAKKSEELPMVPTIQTKKPCDLAKSFECNVMTTTMATKGKTTRSSHGVQVSCFILAFMYSSIQNKQRLLFFLHSAIFMYCTRKWFSSK
jgi:hypothetical protein